MTGLISSISRVWEAPWVLSSYLLPLGGLILTTLACLALRMNNPLHGSLLPKTNSSVIRGKCKYYEPKAEWHELEPVKPWQHTDSIGEVGSVYLHEDSVPNMAGSRSCFKKKLEERKEKKKGSKKTLRCACAPESKEMSWLHSGGHEARQCSPSYVQLPDSPLRASAFSREWKARSPTPSQTEELLSKIHQAQEDQRGCCGMQWGRAR